MSTFQYDKELLTRYPTTVGGVILAQGITNGQTPESLQAAYSTEQQAVLQRIGQTPLSQIASLAAWRGVFRSFGIDPTQYRSAAEALLRRLTKKAIFRASIHWLISEISSVFAMLYPLPCLIPKHCKVQLPCISLTAQNVIQHSVRTKWNIQRSARSFSQM